MFASDVFMTDAGDDQPLPKVGKKNMVDDYDINKRVCKIAKLGEDETTDKRTKRVAHLKGVCDERHCQHGKCDECNQKGDVWRGIEKNAETANDCEICWSDFLYKRHWASIMEDSSKDLFTIVELAELADLARFYRAAIGNPHECM